MFELVLHERSHFCSHGHMWCMCWELLTSEVSSIPRIMCWMTICTAEIARLLWIKCKNCLNCSGIVQYWKYQNCKKNCGQVFDMLLNYFCFCITFIKFSHLSELHVFHVIWVHFFSQYNGFQKFYSQKHWPVSNKQTNKTVASVFLILWLHIHSMDC